MGFHPNTLKIFWKNLVKLLVKCNYIAFFGIYCDVFKPFRQTFGLPPSLSGTAFNLGRLPWKGSCHAVTEGFAFSWEKVLSEAKRMRGRFCLFLSCFPIICHLRDTFPQGKALKPQIFYSKYKFIELKANSKAVPEMEGLATL